MVIIIRVNSHYSDYIAYRSVINNSIFILLYNHTEHVFTSQSSSHNHQVWSVWEKLPRNLYYNREEPTLIYTRDCNGQYVQLSCLSM